MEALDVGRMGVGALALVQAQACLEVGPEYARTKSQFGQPIGKFQDIQFKLGIERILSLFNLFVF